MRALLASILLIAAGFFPAGEAKKQAVPAGFTTVTACILSEISYCGQPQQQLDRHLPGWKIAWYPRAVNGNMAWVATNGHDYAVAIRGTLMEFSEAAFSNWIYQDLNILEQKDWPYSGSASARISLGAYRGWENLTKLKDTLSGKDLLSFLKERARENKPIVFTGHSLGGNLASVYATYFSSALKANDKKARINVISFAAPAAGNEAFANDFNTAFPQSLRVENNADIVTKFPCAEKVAQLGTLYLPALDASKITVGSGQASLSLASVFKGLGTAITALEWKNGFSSFAQTNGSGTLIRTKPSAAKKTSDLSSWFAEARYQHGIAQYAAALGAPVIECGSAP